MAKKKKPSKKEYEKLIKQLFERLPNLKWDGKSDSVTASLVEVAEIRKLVKKLEKMVPYEFLVRLKINDISKMLDMYENDIKKRV